MQSQQDSWTNIVVSSNDEKSCNRDCNCYCVDCALKKIALIEEAESYITKMLSHSNTNFSIETYISNCIEKCTCTEHSKLPTCFWCSAEMQFILAKKL